MLTSLTTNISTAAFVIVLITALTVGQVVGQETIEKPDTSDTKTAQESESEASDSDDEKVDDQKPKDGQAELDKAFELKLSVSSTRDLDKIADLCESAIEKGLDSESEKQAKQLWASVLYEHAKQLNRRITANGTLSTRWRWLRQQAVSRLQKSVELKPDKIDALILLAKLHSLNNGDREAAIEAIEKAIEQITDDPEKLSEALYIRSRLAEDERTRVADLTQAVKINPENTEALMQRALYYLSKDESENAFEDFKKLLAIEKDTIDRHVIISQALRQRELFKEAAAILDMAIAVENDNDDLYVLRAQSYLDAEKNEKALDDLNKALELDRQNDDALSLRARLFLIQQEFDKALNDANELMQQKPEGIEGLYLRSLAYRSQRKVPEAIKDMEALLDKTPDNLDFKLDLAILLNANDTPSKAIPLFDEIIRIAPEDTHSQIYRNRGDAFLSQGLHQKAVDDYETSLDLLEEYEGSEMNAMSDAREKDTKVGVLNNLAWVLATSPEKSVRNGKRAIELATEACELTEYKAAYILSTLASGYAEDGDFESARKWAEKAVELAESDEQRVGLQEELDSYKKDEAWREIENVEADGKEQSDEDSKQKENESEKDKAENDKSSDDDSADEESAEDGDRKR